jgi:hypothetical protein
VGRPARVTALHGWAANTTARFRAFFGWSGSSNSNGPVTEGNGICSMQLPLGGLCYISSITLGTCSIQMVTAGRACIYES